MPVYVRRNGVLVDKKTGEPMQIDRSPGRFPTPRLSYLEPYESPVTGKEISSWAERTRDMDAAGAYDPRDLKKGHVYEKSKGRVKEQGDER